MYLVRFLLIVVITLSASLSTAMEVGHAIAPAFDHSVVGDVADDQPVCCNHASDRTQTCHVLPALVPVGALEDLKPECSGTLYFGIGVLMTGIETAGLLDPPRVV